MMIKIGDFSKISQVTVKTLRYYDEIGLLKPAQIDHYTGYRYYSFDQLPRLNRILALKDLGLSLEQIAQVLAISTYADGAYLVLATREGLVKKTRLTDYDSPRTGGLIAINLRDDDELVGVNLVEATDDLLLVSRKGMSVRFHADDTQLRPMGRSTSGVTGMKFRGGDTLLAMDVIRAGSNPDVFVVFEGFLVVAVWPGVAFDEDLAWSVDHDFPHVVIVEEGGKRSVTCDVGKYSLSEGFGVAELVGAESSFEVVLPAEDLFVDQCS